MHNNNNKYSARPGFEPGTFKSCYEPQSIQYEWVIGACPYTGVQGATPRGNTRCWSNGGMMLAHRRRRWANIMPPLVVRTPGYQWFTRTAAQIPQLFKSAAKSRAHPAANQRPRWRARSTERKLRQPSPWQLTFLQTHAQNVIFVHPVFLNKKLRWMSGCQLHKVLLNSSGACFSLISQSIIKLF